ncbi:MAG: restriction endonuclease [Actinobacteria bacterium]|nr:restriction endonuclease [Actinomycetota bacterium]
MASKSSTSLKNIHPRILDKVFPIKKPLISKIEQFDLERARAEHIIIDALPQPTITDIRCLVEPLKYKAEAIPFFKVLMACPNVDCAQVLVGYIRIDQLPYSRDIKCPFCATEFSHSMTKDELILDILNVTQKIGAAEIVSIPLLHDKGRPVGKVYETQDGDKKARMTLVDSDEICIHEMKKRWCSICREEERRELKEAASRFGIFDFILPLLHPPLGVDFDNILAFPTGKGLFNFQVDGVKWLTEHEHALLGDEMGLGKSIQAIVAIRCLFQVNKISKVLVLSPKSVLTDWERKFSDWAPELRVRKIEGPPEKRQVEWSLPSHVYLCTYDTLRQDLSGSLDGEEERDRAGKIFDLAILDEIQTIKNPEANRTKAARMIKAQMRWGLSGTPLENRLKELIAIFAYLKPGLLKYEDAKWPTRVKKTIEPYFLRRRKADVLPELPAKIYEDVWLDLLPAQREAYERAENEGVVKLDEMGTSATVKDVLALITKLKQICNIEIETKESCKLEYLSERLEEITEQGDKAIVFSQYPEKSLVHINEKLGRFNPLMFTGALSNRQRDDVLYGFKHEDSKVLLASVKAGGVGVTITEANYVFHFDLWWNPSTAIQAEDRAHRIGQKKTVFVTKLFTAGTIEERIENLLKKKSRLFNEVIDDLSETKLEKVLTEEELFSLFGLEKAKAARREETEIDAKLSKELEGLSPREFEELVAHLFEKMKFTVDLTPASKDKGVDVYAKRQTDVGWDYLAIQCKHYPGRSVGDRYVRELLGVKQSLANITKVILVTSGYFSRESWDLARGRNDLLLIDGTGLKERLRAYDIGLQRKNG